MRLAFVTEYDGTNFSGFQKQKNAISVQESIEDALKEVTKKNISINYAGRTDAGVHALSQVFDFETQIERD
ncbi:tRNA pseudouridine(38-40) synthase TruA, partial [Gammaproteobacteria bacterium]|nr:tRNA pseudouridine(38-40) synthase TruA [Gammaproteobacteria bacterium]